MLGWAKVPRGTTRCFSLLRVYKRGGVEHNEGSEHYVHCPSRYRSATLAGSIPISQLLLLSLPENLCGVSAVYGDRRRHLPSSLALPLRAASLSYERRDFLPDEDAAIPDSRATFSLASPFAPGSRFNV